MCISFDRERGVRGVDHYGHSLNEPIDGIVDYNSWRKIARYLQFSLSVLFFVYRMFCHYCLHKKTFYFLFRMQRLIWCLFNAFLPLLNINSKFSMLFPSSGECFGCISFLLLFLVPFFGALIWKFL